MGTAKSAAQEIAPRMDDPEAVTIAEAAAPFTGSAIALEVAPEVMAAPAMADPAPAVDIDLGRRRPARL